MDKTLLTTARWELLNSSSGISVDSTQTILQLLNDSIGYPAPKLGDIPENQTPIAPLPRLDSEDYVAICIGHARDGDEGAVAINGIYEETYNNEIALLLKDRLDAMGVKSKIISHYEGSSYGSAMTWLAEKLKEESFTLAIELHFNSATPSARGFEYLCWYKSVKGKLAAKTFQENQMLEMPRNMSRGIELLGDEAHERGALFCSLTHCPAIICEPFFGSNEEEASCFFTDDGKKKLSDHYANSIKKFLMKIHE